MSEFYLYSTPADAELSIQLDFGTLLVGEPCSANGRSDAHRFTLPDDTPIQGAELMALKVGCITFANRGILRPDLGGVLLDDIHLQPEPAPPTVPTPPARNPHLNPLDVITEIFNSGVHDLSTHDGCGQFTEACAQALYDRQSEYWGHIRKSGAQNQYNTHAVDAIQLLGQSGETAPRIYDIVHDSVSPNASPIFIDKGPADPNLFLPIAELP